MTNELIGIGLYTPAEASRLTDIPKQKLIRWLHGYRSRSRDYPPLWSSQVDLGDGHVYLGFRDLMEARVADGFIKLGISAQRVRQTIIQARQPLDCGHPLSTHQFKTDGRNIFLRTIEAGTDGAEQEQLLNLLKNQYEFAAVINPILKDVVFDRAGSPTAWWPLGASRKIIVDPARSFGQPIDSESSVPVAILARAGQLRGVDAAAQSYDVAKSAIRRAMEFAGMRALRQAA